MHEYLKAARDGAAKKLKAIESGEPHTKVDSSSWSPPESEGSQKQTGMRPVSPRQYKSGGKVHGAVDKKRADRKARKDGGKAMPPVDRWLNRDQKKANDLREGEKHVGGMKKGGRIKREHHADGDAVGDLIRQDQIQQGMKGRGLPMRAPLPPRRPMPAPRYMPDTNLTTQGAKRGGKIAHPDEAADKALIKKMVKPEARTGKKDGGGEKWIQGAIKHPGSLHKALHVPAGEKIPAKKLEKAAHSDNPKLAKKANLAKTLKRMHHADGGATEAQRVGANSSKFYKEGNKPAVQSTKSSDFDAMRNADRNLTTALEQQGYKKGGRIKHASGGETGRGLYVRKGYPHEVPGADGGRTAKKRGGSIGKGKTNVNIMIHPHNPNMAMNPPMPAGANIPPPPRPVSLPPMGSAPMAAPMAAPAMPPMGAARPGMPPMGRKDGGKVEHVIDHAAGGGLGRMEKIKAYGLK